MERQSVSSGVPWEHMVGYSRAVRVGQMVFVAGTTASGPDGQPLYPGDAYQQTKVVLGRIGTALNEVGASFSDVVQTRMYVRDIRRWEEIGRAHGEIFHTVRPVATMVEVSRLIDPDLLVEIEVIAVITEDEHESD